MNKIKNFKIIQNLKLNFFFQVEKFFDLPPYFSEKNFYFDQKKGFYCFQTINKKFCMSSEHGKSGEKGRVHIAVEDSLVSKIRQYYSPHNDLFYNITGQNFSWPTI